MRTSENYRLQRSLARLDPLGEGLEDTQGPFPLTPEGVIDTLFDATGINFYDHLFQKSAEISSIIVTEEVNGVRIVVNTIQDNSLSSRKELPPWMKGGKSFFISLDGRVVKCKDFPPTPLSYEEYDLAYQEIRKVVILDHSTFDEKVEEYYELKHSARARSERAWQSAWLGREVSDYAQLVTITHL